MRIGIIEKAFFDGVLYCFSAISGFKFVAAISYRKLILLCSGGDSSTTYNFSYGVAGLSTAVKIGETWTLVSNDYNSGVWTLAQQLYGNGLWWKYDYDAQTDDLLRRYTNLSDTGGIGYAYTYDSRGQISKIEKKSLTLENGTITGETLLTAEYYGYDAMDRLTRIVMTDGTNLISDIAWTYDADQNVTAITTRVNNNGTLRTDTYAYSYDDDHRPTNTTYGSVSESITYDGYSRVTGKTVQNSGNTVLSTSYDYRDIDAQYTTTQVSSLTSTFGGNTVSHSYTYDANGNILSDGSTTYAYDSLNQLVWEYNTAAGKAWNYAYDLGGNILSKTEYDYADGQTSNPVTVSYTYGDAAWRDLLTAYNGEAITYDGVGNPTNYRGWGMSWQGGRQLASMQKDGTTLSFSYNDAGLRTEKTVNGSTRRYIWNSSQLMADVGASDAFYFHYSSGGELIGYTYKTADAETECILVKNQQGDVERVISADGTILASYTYDAWGNVLTSEGSLAASNPIRYRGYYFDTETSLYYLQSRYYDSAVGRFINADDYVSTGQGICGCNMFAYCLNNPVNYIDKNGINAEALQWWIAGMGWLPFVDLALPIGDILYAGGILFLGAIMLLGPQEDVPQIAYDETDAAYGAPPPNGDDDDGDDDDDEYYYGRQKIGKPKGKTPGNNRAQNKQFRDATKGLNKDQQRAVHNEISGSGLGFHDIVDAAKHILFLFVLRFKEDS